MFRKLLAVCFGLAAVVAVVLALLPGAQDRPLALDVPRSVSVTQGNEPSRALAPSSTFCDALDGTCVAE